jgi:hypothetical protein
MVVGGSRSMVVVGWGRVSAAIRIGDQESVIRDQDRGEVG